MRKAFDPQLRLDCPEITSIPLNVNCRHEIIPILRVLQHICARPEVQESILQAIASDVNRLSNPKRGHPGMSYWEIVVLKAVRLGCNHNCDELSDLAQNHRIGALHVLAFSCVFLSLRFPNCGFAASRLCV